jgi:nucleoside-diphosphate-sugar epimerase
MSNPLIFITGATGFIGSHVALSALEGGYRVRLSVRKPEQERTLEARYSKFASQVEVIVVPDITKSSSLVDSLDGVDYIFHLASPMPGKGSEFQADYVRPAVQATEAILHAALNFPQIQKVMVMSSVLALLPPTAAGSSDVSVTGKFYLLVF